MKKLKLLFLGCIVFLVGSYFFITGTATNLECKLTLDEKTSKYEEFRLDSSKYLGKGLFTDKSGNKLTVFVDVSYTPNEIFVRRRGDYNGLILSLLYKFDRNTLQFTRVTVIEKQLDIPEQMISSNPSGTCTQI